MPGGWNGKFENVTSDNVVYAKYTGWTITISDKDAEGKVTVTPSADCKYVCITIDKSDYDGLQLNNTTNLVNAIKENFDNAVLREKYIEITPSNGEITIAFYTKVSTISNLSVDSIIGTVVTKVW